MIRKAASFLDMHPCLPLVVMLLVGLGLRVAFVFFFDEELKPPDDAWWYYHHAASLVAGESTGSHLKAYQPPLYPYFMAACFSLFGTNVMVFKLVQAVMGAGTVLVIYCLTKALSSPLAGLVAASFAAVYPSILYFGVTLHAEGLFTFLMVTAYATLFASKRRSSWQLRVVSGILLGLAALTREAAVFAAGGILIWYRAPLGKWSVALRHWSGVVLPMALVILPWSIRNYSVFGHVVPISTNGGINFYIGNNPQATGRFAWITPPNSKFNAPAPPGFPEGYYEYETMKLGYQHGWSFVKTHPERFALLTLKRIYFCFLPPIRFFNSADPLAETAAKALNLLIYVVVLACSLALPIILRRGISETSFLLYVTVSAILLPPSLTYVFERYREPAFMFLIPIAAINIANLILRRQSHESSN